MEISKYGNTMFQNFGDTTKAVLMEVYSDTGLPQETRKTSNNLTLYLNELEKEQSLKVEEKNNKDRSKNRD